jgi:glucose/arabinose dehydrogenase
MAKLLVALAVGVVSCGAGAAQNAPIHPVSAPKAITLGQTWTATLQTVAKRAGRPRVTARHGSDVVRARSTPVGQGRYRVRLRLGAVGTWHVTASLAGRNYKLASVFVRAAAPYALDNPAQVIEAQDGALLVAERGTRNRILRVDPTTGAFTVLATDVPSPWGLGFDTDGSLLVSSTSGLYRVADGKSATKVADVSISPFAVMKDGDVAFANETSVGIIPAGSGRPRLLPVTVNFAHGLALLGDGELAISDTGNGRLIRVDPVDGHTTVITTALKTPLGLIAEPSGSLLAVEFDRGQVVRVSVAGDVTTFARGLSKPYALARTHDGTVYVMEAGDVARASGALRRVAPDGTVATIRLVKR